MSTSMVLQWAHQWWLQWAQQESSIAGVETVAPSTLYEAIEVGYRHFGTVAVYGMEKSIGEAVAEALLLGLVSRKGVVDVEGKQWQWRCGSGGGGGGG